MEPITRRSLLSGLAGVTLAPFAVDPHAWAAVYGGYEVPAEVLSLYQANRSWIGLPTSARIAVTGGFKQKFQHADLYYGKSVGASIVTSHIKSAYDAKGGPAYLGLPIGTQKTSTTYSSRTQRFADGRIWWSSAHGSKVVRETKTVRLSGAPNFRDIAGEGSGIAVTGGRMKRGIAYRSSTTSSITRMDKFILQTLDVGTLVALSPSSVANVTGIDRARYQLNNPSSQTLAEKKRMYAQYVSSAANRASIGKAIQFLAGSDEAVVFQCLRGWDRTGWFAAVIQGLLGASSSTIMSEFLKSNDYYGNGVQSAYLNAAISEMKSRYGSYRGYATACGVSSSRISTLRAKLVD